MRTSRIREHYLSGASHFFPPASSPSSPPQKAAPRLRDPGRMETSVIWIFSFVKCLLESFVHLFIWLPVTWFYCLFFYFEDFVLLFIM